jgi:hypothetical protein
MSVPIVDTGRSSWENMAVLERQLFKARPFGRAERLEYHPSLAGVAE